MRRRPRQIAVGLAAILGAACAGSDPAREADRAFTSGEAVVEGVEILQEPDATGQARVRAFGTLDDACTSIDRVRRRRFGDSVDVTISTRRPAGALCAAEAVPFERIISINLAGSEPGLYTVTVNGVSVIVYYDRNPFDDPLHRDDSIL